MVTRADRVTTGKKQQDIYYSDFLNNLNRHPQTGLLNRTLNENSVGQSIKNLIFTNVGERFFQPTIGGNIKRILFEPMNGFTADALKKEITQTLFNNEPRLSQFQVIVQADEPSNSYRVKIIYAIKTIQDTSTLDITLKRVR